MPDRELRAGLAEVIKYGPIADAEFLTWIEANLDALLARDKAALAHAVRRSCEIKAWVVQQDERESGCAPSSTLGTPSAMPSKRAWAMGRGCMGGSRLRHVARVGPQRPHGRMPADFVGRMRGLLERTGLPVVAPALLGVERYMSLMRGDKKSEAGEIRFVLIEALGRARHPCRTRRLGRPSPETHGGA